MTRRIGDYTEIDSEGYLDEDKHKAAIQFLKDKGKKNPVPYGIGGIVVHHKNIYYMINTQTYKWCNRRCSNRKWRRANSMEEVYAGMEHNSKWANHYSDVRKGKKESDDEQT